MKDEFKRAGRKLVGPGGMKCRCCSVEKCFLRRQSRRRMKNIMRSRGFQAQMQEEINKG